MTYGIKGRPLAHHAFTARHSIAARLEALCASNFEICWGPFGAHCCVRRCRKRNEECEDKETHDDIVGSVVSARRCFAFSPLLSTSYRSFTESRSFCAENLSDDPTRFLARRLPHRECQFIVTIVRRKSQRRNQGTSRLSGSAQNACPFGLEKILHSLRCLCCTHGMEM